jgi:hypothetical protein
MEFPRITLVTPRFDQGQFLEETIQSVLDLDYSNVDFCISPVMADFYRERLRVEWRALFGLADVPAGPLPEPQPCAQELRLACLGTLTEWQRDTEPWWCRTWLRRGRLPTSVLDSLNCPGSSNVPACRSRDGSPLSKQRRALAGAARTVAREQLSTEAMREAWSRSVANLGALCKQKSQIRYS